MANGSETHLFKDGIVSANFEADMKAWANLDVDSIRLTDETLLDAFQRANLDFKPLEAQAYVINPINGDKLDMNKKAIINPITNEIIGEVGVGFNAMSHYDTLKAVLGVVMDKGMIPSRFVNLGGGARMVAQCYIPKEYRGGGRDHKCFATLYTGLDGTTSVRGGLSIITPACMNTLNKMKADLMDGVRHTLNMQLNLTRISKAMDIIQKESLETMTLFDTAYGKEANLETVKEFINFMTPIGKNKATENRQAHLSRAINDTIMEVKTGETIPVPTFYDLLAGATRFTTYVAQNRTQNEQYESILDGSGDKFNQKALNWVVANI